MMKIEFFADCQSTSALSGWWTVVLGLILLISAKVVVYPSHTNWQANSGTRKENFTSLLDHFVRNTNINKSEACLFTAYALSLGRYKEACLDLGDDFSISEVNKLAREISNASKQYLARSAAAQWKENSLQEVGRNYL